MKINRKEYLDKVMGCWIGKNIGGTMGAPYEGKPEMNDCTGFNTPEGSPLPNDDLDLQLIWLMAVEDYGIRQITPQLLGEYWLDWITAPWNEYGQCKTNMRAGLLPPYTGEFENERWKHSNGAWIRTEIWACLFPGYPELAVHYAYTDACVDHGMGEGTVAAMFVAALESAAFFEKDIRKLIDGALKFIPEDSRVAKSVKKAIELYDNGTDFTDARNAVVEETKDLGWFQAPANVSFAILGLLYGEGDFKKTMLYAINCGDDTDCTAATVGSIMGIMNGRQNIPEDWANYIGDDIKSVAIDMSAPHEVAKSCSELTRKIYELLPSTLKAYRLYFEYTDSEPTELEPLMEKSWRHIWMVPDFEIPSTGLSMNFPDLIYAKARVEFDKCKVEPNESVKMKFVFTNVSRDIKIVDIKLTLPDGWTADKDSTFICLHRIEENLKSETEITVTAPENPSPKSVIYAYVKAQGRITSGVLPITFWRK